MKLLLFAAFVALASAEKVRYDGYVVFEVVPENSGQFTLLKTMEENYDFWLEATKIGHPVHVMVSPEQMGKFLPLVRDMGMEPSIYVENVQAAIDAETPSTNDVYTTFARYDEYMAELDNLVEMCDPDFECAVETIGSSIEGRDIKVFHMKHVDQHEEPVLWIDSAIHAREWLSPVTAINIVRELVRGDTQEARQARLDWQLYYVAMMNPDGYEYSHTNDRMWRKNRRNNSGSACLGVDLNRNWDWLWGEPGASGSPCSSTYRGASVASEPETYSVQDYASALAQEYNIEISWSVHTYGPYWLVPYGDCTWHTEYEDDQRECAEVTADAIEFTFNEHRWIRGNSCQELYMTSGTTADWFLGVADSKYAITPELRPGQHGGFIANVNDIPLSVEEVRNGFYAKLDWIRENDRN